MKKNKIENLYIIVIAQKTRSKEELPQLDSKLNYWPNEWREMRCFPSKVGKKKTRSPLMHLNQHPTRSPSNS